MGEPWLPQVGRRGARRGERGYPFLLVVIFAVGVVQLIFTAGTVVDGWLGG